MTGWIDNELAFLWKGDEWWEYKVRNLFYVAPIESAYFYLFDACLFRYQSQFSSWMHYLVCQDILAEIGAHLRIPAKPVD